MERDRTTKTTAPIAGCLGKRERFAGAFHQEFHQITKADPGNVIRGVSDIGKASLQHCEYISSRTVLPLLPESLDGFQMREEARRRGVKRASGTTALMVLHSVNNSAALRRPGRRLPGGNNKWCSCSRAGFSASPGAAGPG